MTAEERCHVCSAVADDSNSAHCSQCGRRFHLVLTNAGNTAEKSDPSGKGSGGKDCGAVWIDDSTMALEFGCEPCLAELRGEAPGSASSTSGGAAAPSQREPSRPARARKQPGSARDVVRRKLE